MAYSEGVLQIGPFNAQDRLGAIWGMGLGIGRALAVVPYNVFHGSLESVQAFTRLNTEIANQNRQWAEIDLKKATKDSTKAFNQFIRFLKPSVVASQNKFENIGLLAKQITHRLFALGKKLADPNNSFLENKSRFLKKLTNKIASRLVYGLGGIAAVATRVADFVLGLFAAVVDIFCAPHIGWRSQWQNRQNYTQVRHE